MHSLSHAARSARTISASSRFDRARRRRKRSPRPARARTIDARRRSRPRPCAFRSSSRTCRRARLASSRASLPSAGCCGGAPTERARSCVAGRFCGAGHSLARCPRGRVAVLCGHEGDAALPAALCAVCGSDDGLIHPRRWLYPHIGTDARSACGWWRGLVRLRRPRLDGEDACRAAAMGKRGAHHERHMRDRRCLRRGGELAG